jgi:hypothetical protein
MHLAEKWIRQKMDLAEKWIRQSHNLTTLVSTNTRLLSAGFLPYLQILDLAKNGQTLQLILPTISDHESKVDGDNTWISGLYFKHVMIVNYASSGVNKLKASLDDDARVIIYDRHMFIVQDTGLL